MDGTSLPEVRSACPYCGVGCGVLLQPDGVGGVAVRGDPKHPANFGRLCSKGAALGETVGLEHRLLAPLVEGRETTWDQALDLVASTFKETIAKHGPDSAAFYVSGQLLTEDYYVANKLMKGFIGSANIDTNSRLCMASTVAGHKRAFGTDTVPGSYEDLDEADLIVLVGSNLAWCHPVLHQRVLAARQQRGTRIVVIDPRRTASCEPADMHLALAPGSDVALFNALLAAIHREEAVNQSFAPHVEGLEDAIESALAEDPKVTGLTPNEIEAFCQLWIGTRRVVTVFSQGVNQSTSGSDKVNAILNCHLAMGRIGKPGCGPFSVTGQPNAMGGREVGGLANMLACHLDIENPAHREAVGTLWEAPVMPETPGLKAVDMFDAVGRGDIKALWIIHTNPAVSLPKADVVRDAIKGCDFVVVSDVTARTDTARLADVVLPATAWGEKDGTVTNSDRTITRQRSVLPAPGLARPDWDILADMGRRMGWTDAFAYTTPVEIFREHAALSGIAAGFGRDFDISDLADMSSTDYDAFAPTQWPITNGQKGKRFFSDGRFFHASGKARALPVRWRPPAAVASPSRPLILNTGRVRDQWHTMTRTALSPTLSSHLAEPYLDVHPADASRLGLSTADLAEVSSEYGTALLRVRITEGQGEGSVFAPIHWTGETAAASRIDAVVAPATDPVSGQPESKASVVSVAPFKADWYGFAVSVQEPRPATDYWARVRTPAGWRLELANQSASGDWEAEARALFSAPTAQVQIFEDTNRGSVRLALFENDRLIAALFVARQPVAVMRDYLATLPGTDGRHALSGRTPAGMADPGPTVCACFGVGLNTIISAIETQTLTSVEAIGDALRAGTNCGACRPELATLLPQDAALQAAE